MILRKRLAALERKYGAAPAEGLIFILAVVRSRRPDGSYCGKFWNEDGKPTGKFVELPVKAYVRTADGMEVVLREEDESEEAFLARLPEPARA
jgi:hypothetical protein